MQDNLLGKTVKCPHCQANFTAERLPDSGTKAPTPEVDPPLAPAPTGDDAHSVKTPADEGTPAPAERPISTQSGFSSWGARLTRPIPRLPLQVFGIITAIVLLAAAIGYGLGSWLAAGVR